MISCLLFERNSGKTQYKFSNCTFRVKKIIIASFFRNFESKSIKSMILKFDQLKTLIANLRKMKKKKLPKCQSEGRRAKQWLEKRRGGFKIWFPSCRATNTKKRRKSRKNIWKQVQAAKLEWWAAQWETSLSSSRDPNLSEINRFNLIKLHSL